MTAEYKVLLVKNRINVINKSSWSVLFHR